MIYFLLRLGYESVLVAVSPDGTGTRDGFTEVNIYGGACGRLNTFQLPRGGNVKSLHKEH